MKLHVLAVQLVTAITCSAWAQAPNPLTAEEMECGTFSQVGRLKPEDFRRATSRLQVVEEYHFGPHTEALVRPMQIGGAIGGDIDYTLWGYPNHHRALAALTRLGAREGTNKPKGAQFTIDCYFRRALRFVPDDHVTRMLYASYLVTQKHLAEARRHIDFVSQQSTESPLTLANAGLIYLQLGELDIALVLAHRSMALGWQPIELKRSLEKAGKWVEPGSSAESPPQAVTPASSAESRSGAER